MENKRTLEENKKIQAKNKKILTEVMKRSENPEKIEKSLEKFDKNFEEIAERHLFLENPREKTKDSQVSIKRISQSKLQILSENDNIKFRKYGKKESNNHGSSINSNNNFMVNNTNKQQISTINVTNVEKFNESFKKVHNFKNYFLMSNCKALIERCNGEKHKKNNKKALNARLMKYTFFLDEMRQKMPSEIQKKRKSIEKRNKSKRKGSNEQKKDHWKSFFTRAGTHKNLNEMVLKLLKKKKKGNK